MLDQYAYESEEVDGFGIRVYQDTDPPVNPRQDYDNMGKLVFTPRTDLIADGISAPKYWEDYYMSGGDWLADYMMSDGASVVVLLDYSTHGAACNIAVSDPFTGRRGVQEAADELKAGNYDGALWITGQKVIEEYGKRSYKRAGEYLKAEAQEYAAYATGEVYGYVVIDPEGDEIHSCWGFIGEPSYALQEGIDHARACAEERDKENAAVRYWQERDVETVAA